MRNLIVGVDGSTGSLSALDWAAQTVGRTGRLHAVLAVNPVTERLVDLVSGDVEVSWQDSDFAALGRWTSDAGFAVGELATSLRASTMAQALDDAAREDDADGIVVGAHRSFGAIVPRVGRPASRLLRSTHHPVIVVPEGTHETLDGGHVVVGIGHGDATRSAVRWAAHLSRTRKLTIELLHAADDAPVFQADGPRDFVRYETGRVDERAWDSGRIDHFAALASAVAGPDLDLVLSTPRGLAALRLDDASERSALLVIGRHRSVFDGGHHTAQPLRHALTHARCPVAVIPDHDQVTVETDGGS